MGWIKVAEVTGEEISKRTHNVREMMDLFEKKVKGKIKKDDTWCWQTDDNRDAYNIMKWEMEE
jgi:hypothetical protein